MGSWTGSGTFPRTPLGAVAEALRTFSSRSLLQEQVGVVKGGAFCLLVNDAVDGRGVDSFVVSGEQMERLYRETVGSFDAVVHTHPSGDDNPSEDDLEMLQELYPYYEMEFGVIAANVCSYQGYLKVDNLRRDVEGPMDLVLGNWTEYDREGVLGKWKVCLSEKSVSVDQVDL